MLGANVSGAVAQAIGQELAGSTGRLQTEVGGFIPAAQLPIQRLHSLRPGGAIAAVTNNPNSSERLLKFHRRWKSDIAKDMYILEQTQNCLSVTCNLGLTALFNNMRTLKFKAQPTNAFFATAHQLFGGSSQLPTMLSKRFDLITARSAVVGSWEELLNI